MHTVSNGWICLGTGDCGLRAWEREGESVYALVWRVKEDGNYRLDDTWSARVMDFKNNRPLAVRGFSAVLCKMLPMLMASLSLNLKDRLAHVTTALSAGATSAQLNTPLYRLAEGLCGTLPGMKFCPDLLRKKMHRRLADCPDAQSRDAEVRHAYECEPLERKEPLVLVLDDFVTRGATFSAIKSAIAKANRGAQMIPVALGKHVSQKDIRHNDNDDRLGDMEQFWG